MHSKTDAIQALRIKGMADAQGISLADLAKRSGIEFDRLRQYIANGVGSLDGGEVKSLAGVLNVRAAYLSDGVT